MNYIIDPLTQTRTLSKEIYGNRKICIPRNTLGVSDQKIRHIDDEIDSSMNDLGMRLFAMRLDAI